MMQYGSEPLHGPNYKISISMTCGIASYLAVNGVSLAEIAEVFGHKT